MNRDSFDLLIIGAGGHGRVVADVATMQGYKHIAFVDSNYDGPRSNLHWPVVGKAISEFASDVQVFVAIGNCEIRLNQLSRLLKEGRKLATLVHPSASVSNYAKLGVGTVVMPQAVVNAGATLGFGVIVNSGATVDHDCLIGDGVHVSPGAHLAGGVSVGNATWVGIGACVREGINIGAHSIIGAGSVVVNDIPARTKVMGIPARERQ